jgi:hypothetical protein
MVLLTFRVRSSAQGCGSGQQCQLIGFRDASAKDLIGPEGRTGSFGSRQTGSRLVVDDGLSLKIATLAGGGIAVHSLWSGHSELAAQCSFGVPDGVRLARTETGVVPNSDRS